MDKTIFKKRGEIHLGVNPPPTFESADLPEAKAAFEKRQDMKLWRCTICNDLHMGLEPPKECPTCNVVDAYVEIDENEFKTLIGLKNE